MTLESSPCLVENLSNTLINQYLRYTYRLSHVYVNKLCIKNAQSQMNTSVKKVGKTLWDVRHTSICSCTPVLHLIQYMLLVTNPPSLIYNKRHCHPPALPHIYTLYYPPTLSPHIVYVTDPHPPSYLYVLLPTAPSYSTCSERNKKLLISYQWHNSLVEKINERWQKCQIYLLHSILVICKMPIKHDVSDDPVKIRMCSFDSYIC